MFADQTESSGLDFVYRESDFDDFEREPLLPFQLSRLGGSISCGDVDGDGSTDVFCGGAAGQPATLFLNRSGKFEKVSGPWESKSVKEDMACLFFDADGDGNTDLYVTSGSTEFDADSENYRDSLYRNTGDGTFEDVTKNSLPALKNSSMSAAAGDYDRDGDLDLFVGSRSVPENGGQFLSIKITKAPFPMKPRVLAWAHDSAGGMELLPPILMPMETWTTSSPIRDSTPSITPRRTAHTEFTSKTSTTTAASI
jgi:hypothetical protein